jgi:hypothetical protein
LLAPEHRAELRALPTRGQRAIAAAMVDALRSGAVGHDEVFDAAGSLGSAGLAELERLARSRSRVRRAHAIACIGNTSHGVRAIACLERIARRTGVTEAMLVAVFNLHHAAGTSLALRGLACTDAARIEMACMAVSECLRAAGASRGRFARAARAARAALSRVVERRLARRRLSERSVSALEFALDGLAASGDPTLPVLLVRGLRTAKHPEVHRALRNAQRGLVAARARARRR